MTHAIRLAHAASPTHRKQEAILIISTDRKSPCPAMSEKQCQELADMLEADATKRDRYRWSNGSCRISADKISHKKGDLIMIYDPDAPRPTMSEKQCRGLNNIIETNKENR
ncbi:MAG: hypothetical protein LBD28_00070 [Tannerellaceae bacterium]|jgi:hypothetical protein|nr:hypothetical protein [Tannerellaceae bacterium]